MKGVVMFPDKVLRKKIEPVKKIDKKTLREIEELKKILQESENGAGLAAPQIGVNKSFFGIKEKGGVRMLINPKLIAVYGEKVYPKMVDNEGKESDFLEGCLSFPGLFGTVKRYYRIEVKWQELVGKKLTSKSEIFEGFLAIVLQHEIDHLDGILFVDHVKKDRGKFYKTIEGKLVKEKIEMVLK